jgi:sortase (surface protein transpeptidase)
MGISHALTAGNHRGLTATVVAGVLALSGVGLIGYAATHQEHAPQPPLSAVGSTDPTAGDPSSASSTPSQEPTAISRPAPARTKAGRRPRPAAPKVVGTVMKASEPVALAIPAIGVKAPLTLHLGQTAQGTIEVPAPGPRYNEAAWYRYSPTPGSLGPAVIVGHVDSAEDGPSVFFRLGALRPHDKVRITREDGSVATFAVDDVRRFEKSQFPTRLVYGNTNHAALRLITCGGPFDRDTGSYKDNIVVLASLVPGSV